MTEAEAQAKHISRLLLSIIKEARLEYQTGLHSNELSRKIMSLEDLLGGEVKL